MGANKGFKKKGLLKTLGIVLSGLVLFVAACGGGEPAATAVPQPTSTPLPASADTPIAVVRPTEEVVVPTTERPSAVGTATPRAVAPEETPVPPTPEASDPIVAPGDAAARLVADSTEWMPGDEVRVSVRVIPGTLGITGAELKVTFDQNIFEARAIAPGELLGESPLVALNEIDNALGEAIMALARLGPTDTPTKTGVLATVIFEVRPTAPSGGGSLEIASLALANQDFEDVAEVALSGLSFSIGER